MSLDSASGCSLTKLNLIPVGKQQCREARAVLCSGELSLKGKCEEACGGIGDQVGVHDRTPSLLQSEKKAITGMLFGG